MDVISRLEVVEICCIPFWKAIAEISSKIKVSLDEKFRKHPGNHEEICGLGSKSTDNIGWHFRSWCGIEKITIIMLFFFNRLPSGWAKDIFKIEGFGDSKNGQKMVHFLDIFGIPKNVQILKNPRNKHEKMTKIVYFLRFFVTIIDFTNRFMHRHTHFSNISGRW